MYDATFDQSPHSAPASDRRFLWAIRIAALLGVAIAGAADAQLPGAPVLQNAWATPGLVAAVNLGGGSDGSVYAAAVGWSPGSGRFQLSAGAGAQSRTGTGSKGAYGLRVAVPLGGASSAIGFAGFAGVGGGTGGSAKPASAPSLTITDSVSSTTEIPLGVAIGWRHAIGSNHGLSVYGTPSYVIFSGGSKSGGIMRAAVGADVGITNAIGATLGIEFGGTRPRGVGGPSSTLYGLGVSYALGRR